MIFIVIVIIMMIESSRQLLYVNFFQRREKEVLYAGWGKIGLQL